MFRRWLSGFWRDYKEKIIIIAKLFGLLVIIGISAGVIFSSFGKKEKTNVDVTKEVYNPSKTVIEGSDISQEEFKKEDNIVQEFVDFCNNGNIEGAYSLLTDECKQKLYPTLDSFKNNYYNIIFANGKKEYNLQSWINSGNYNTYRVRFMEDFITTGNYEDTVKYEDYITIVTKDNTKKLNINSYIKTEKINKVTKTEEIEANVLSKDFYMDYIIFNLNVKNLGENDILLDSLETNVNTRLIGTNDAEYRVDTTNLKFINLKINTEISKDIKLKFFKQYVSDAGEVQIKFKRVITNYSEYRVNKENYNNYKEISIDL